MEDLRKKFHLLEGDRKLFYHSSSLAKQKNREQISQLQKENKELREQLKSRVSTPPTNHHTPTTTHQHIRYNSRFLMYNFFVTDTDISWWWEWFLNEPDRAGLRF